MKAQMTAFLDSLRRSLNTTRGVYPPVALAEIYCEDSLPSTRIRRLHLIVVDLDRSRNVSKRVYGQFQEARLSAACEECFNTLPVPTIDPECPYRCRYVYGYGIDGSDLPSYVLWPRRGPGGHFWFVDPWTGRFFDPSRADFLAPIGLEHFFDAFALIHKRSIRVAAAHALNIPIEDIQANLVVKQARAQLFRLTPIWVPEEPPAKRAKKTPESAASTQDASMASGEAKVGKESSDESDSDSSGSNSDFSSEDGSSELLLARPMMMCRGLHWKEVWIPSKRLPRLTIPLSGFSKQLERLLEGYCMEVMATNARPDLHLPSIEKFAKDLVLLFAFQSLHCSGKSWTIPRKCSMILRARSYSCPSFGFSLFTENCAILPPVRGLAGTVSCAALRVGWLKCSANLLTVWLEAKVNVRVNC